MFYDNILPDTSCFQLHATRRVRFYLSWFNCCFVDLKKVPPPPPSQAYILYYIKLAFLFNSLCVWVMFYDIYYNLEPWLSIIS